MSITWAMVQQYAPVLNSHVQIVVIQDADLEYLPDCLPFLVKPITAGKMDIVYGSKFKEKPEG